MGEDHTLTYTVEDERIFPEKMCLKYHTSSALQANFF